jgi:hypothetical protein
LYILYLLYYLNILSQLISPTFNFDAAEFTLSYTPSAPLIPKPLSVKFKPTLAHLPIPSYEYSIGG